MTDYNTRPGRHMRFCESCGVGIGIMTREAFTELYVDQPGKCPVCGKPVHVIPKKPEGSWINLTTARILYRVEARDISAAAKNGMIPSRRQGRAILVPEKEVAAIYGRREP